MGPPSRLRYVDRRFSDRLGNLSQIDLTAVAPAGAAEKTFTAVALLALEHTEPLVTDVGAALLAGRWLRDEDDEGLLLSRHVADQLGLGPGGIGRRVRLFGRELPVIGIFDAKK